MARPLGPQPHRPAFWSRSRSRKEPGTRSRIRFRPHKHASQVRHRDAFPEDQPHSHRQTGNRGRSPHCPLLHDYLKPAHAALSLGSSLKGALMIKALFVAAAVLVIGSSVHSQTYAIQAGHLIVDATQPELGNSTVIVDHGRIARIENGFTAPNGAIMVDERNMTVMPGMTDVHVHLTSTSGEPWYSHYTKKYSVPYEATVGLSHALEMAQGGFTTVRDLGGNTSAVVAVREAISERRFFGPR